MNTRKQQQQHFVQRALWTRVILFVLVVGAVCYVGASLCDAKESGADMAGLMGAPKDVSNAENSVEMDDMGRFAVDQYNTKEGKNLSFKNVVSAKKQVVSGTMYHMVIEAHGDDSVKMYDAKVWHKPWENHKSLEHFKPQESSATGMRSVPVGDPVIKEAAEHALKGLNDRSNSLVPYELRQVMTAHAEATDEHTNFDLHIKVARGAKEEEMKAELHRTADGKWSLKHAGPM
ncbi:hypothetical protein MPTK1_7g11520 [Marchantia polymorpha subsp. ruderalis]|uniref:Cysteine proteinase inhibitor n=2 Tax=Marchantia polymorpha TaxID=3197 RepID=A0AAF6BYG2_MARPO|nr:hypothetical protein MARPO_0003s0166 [Marchantia polymorpha]BBN17046.1 hypothetical protein Mp_7g11520 [Marchantia polymorpha subsp. ruderalis]|eukprot:PTQ49282.1 hypothetical protein MARPO_0003s0166 [Marchantia polymorpha]